MLKSGESSAVNLHTTYGCGPKSSALMFHHVVVATAKKRQYRYTYREMAAFLGHKCSNIMLYRKLQQAARSTTTIVNDSVSHAIFSSRTPSSFLACWKDLCEHVQVLL